MVFFHKFSIIQPPNFLSLSEQKLSLEWFSIKNYLPAFFFCFSITSVKKHLFFFLPVAGKQQQIKFFLLWNEGMRTLSHHPSKYMCWRKNSIKFHMLYRCEHPIFLFTRYNVWCFIFSERINCFIKKCQKIHSVNFPREMIFLIMWNVDGSREIFCLSFTDHRKFISFV